MSCPFSEEQLTQLKVFVDLCRSEPQILLHPKLSFFKEYLTSLGVVLPSATFGTKNFTASGDGNAHPTKPEDAPKKQEPSEQEDDMESDVELDMEGVIEPDVVSDSQEMGDLDKQPSEEQCDESDEKRSQAMRAFNEQQYEEAVALYTDAINLNPQSALLYAKRGQVYLKLNKPNACIQDCTRALLLNCDSAAAYKFRGRAYRLLGKFEEAAQDLCESLKIDYDDQTNAWLAEVKPNADKLRQHRLTQLRKKEEKEHRERLGRARKAQEARKEARSEARSDPRPEPANDGLLEDIMGFYTDPEVMAVMQDPEISQALFDVTQNPANLAKYQNNPKVAAAIDMFYKRSKNFNKAKAEDEKQPPTAEQPKKADDDVGLD